MPGLPQPCALLLAVFVWPAALAADSGSEDDRMQVHLKIRELEHANSTAGTYVVRKGQRAKEEIQAERTAVKSNLDNAKRSLDESERAGSSPTAMRHLSEAMSAANQAQSYTRRLEQSIRSDSYRSAGGQDGPSRRGIQGDSSALRTLMEMERGGAPAQREGFDGSNRNAPDAVPWRGTGTNFFGSQDARAYDRQRAALTTSDGHTVNVRPLIEALQRVSPSAAAQPFVTASDGSVRLSAEAQRALAQSGAQLRNIGGISLEVTFQRLALAGVPDFRAPGPVTLVENPVLISLRRLVAAARPYASSPERWRSLPEGIRYPGGISRIIGYVVEPQTQDVFLLGTKRSSREARLDIDALSVLASSVWARGTTPTISLDPLPSDPTGPQYPRIIDLPRDALVTKIMVDADYAMKRINLGALPMRDAGIESLAEVYAKSPPKEPFAARFWLRPMPLKVDAIHVSISGRTVLFDAGVQALAESVRIDPEGIAGTGATDPVHEHLVESFTRSYERLESSNEISPRAIFALLHGVVDMVTLFKLLRESGVDYPVLADLGQLPYARLAGTDAIPSQYDGLRVPYSKTSSGLELSVSGGVELRARPTRPSLDRFDDYVSRAIERAATELPPEGFARQTNLSFTLPAPRLSAGTGAEVAKQAGYRELAAGRLANAMRYLQQAAAKDPTDIDAWTYLAWVEGQLGHTAMARRAIGEARALGGDDFLTGMVVLDIELFANPALDVSGESAALLRELSNGYTTMAYAALHRHDSARALRHAERAVRLWHGNSEALLARSLAQSIDRPELARRDSSAAVNLLRDSLRQGNDNARYRLAWALTLNVANELDEVPRQMEAKVADSEVPALVAKLLAQAQDALERSKEAAALDPRLSLAAAAEIRARGVQLLLTQVAKATDQPAPKVDPREAQNVADHALALFPKSQAVRVERSILFQLQGNPKLAEREIDAAMSLNPSDPRSLLLRGAFRAQLGNCDGARQDVQRARTLGRAIDDRAARMLAESDCH